MTVIRWHVGGGHRANTLLAFAISVALPGTTSAQVVLPLDQTVTIATHTTDDALATPCNLLAPPPLRPVIEHMWRQSPTFQAQCSRLRGTSSLLVEIRFGTASQLGAVEGRTDFRRSSPNGLRADVYIDINVRSLYRWIELIAHELEHVVEQLDDVELTSAARHGVYLTASGAFETARAVHIGQKVRREVEEATHNASTLRRR